MTDREKIAEARRRGRTVGQIAQDMGLTEKVVLAAIEATMTEIRDLAPLLLEETFHLHYERLEVLFAIVQRKIDDMVDFNADVFKVALSILERQAKLLGLDKKEKSKTKTGKARKEAGWLDEATPAELLDEAEAYGLEVTKFKL